MAKNPPAMQEAWAQSLGWEDPLEKAAPHSSVFAWRTPWKQEPGGLWSIVLQRQTDTTEPLPLSLSSFLGI